jgi:hypothetical protein
MLPSFNIALPFCAGPFAYVLPVTKNCFLVFFCFLFRATRLLTASITGKMERLLQETVLLVVLHAAYFGFGLLFYRKKLFKDYEAKDPIVQFLFCSTFTLSCSMFQLIIFEIVGFLDPK